MNAMIRMHHVCSSIACLLGLSLGCASSETNDLPPSTTTDSGVDSPVDGGGDTGKCTPGAKESAACGKCGTHEHTCQADGSFGPFTACTGEKSGPFVCTLGDTRTSSCGKCGTSKDTCDDSCGWVPGTCAGEGECNAGDVDKVPCTGADIKTRTCTTSCKWGDYSTCAAPPGWKTLAAPPTGFDARRQHTAVWTGTDMLVWGGQGSAARKDGARYTLSSDTWKVIGAAPTNLSTGRYDHVAVWTGKEMIVWGGVDSTLYYKGDGARYDDATGSWKAMATSPLTPRSAPKNAVWSTTTSEMIVWGGTDGTVRGDGAAYDPAADTWALLPVAPIGARVGHSMLWTGSVVLIWGGGGSGGVTSPWTDGATYDPKTKTWTKLAALPSGTDGRWGHVGVLSDKEFLFWGGYGGTTIATGAVGSGARIQPSGTTWTMFSAPDDTIFTPSKRYDALGWWLGGKLYVWAGTGGMPTAAFGGAIYDVASDKWSKLDVTGAPDSRLQGTVVNTSKEVIVWGGCKMPGDATTCLSDGAVFRP
jgi:N-acetylneuraminic acid mutarotase